VLNTSYYDEQKKKVEWGGISGRRERGEMYTGFWWGSMK
jgi:hypothetical protein